MKITDERETQKEKKKKNHKDESYNKKVRDK